ncbi:C45 family autoproteolytic acyltransferase/hydolase [Jeotgalibacillus campisalis]|uniref:Acyl-CoA:6-aminopenicillanic acid acyl-transferase n=1 Tax=Jeotgalibacillus campisalis TaxID=220754 RepID=A0A0C2S1K2_9BACL|nr:C45 family peptidase [Jeotgalibacillus campisalis]KIL47919.1 acyl-CoA:6-aminopenicillanic acid acyl-transferase [Jeotgalibacillus campisalis]
MKFHVDVIKGTGSYFELGILEATKFIQTPLYHSHINRRKISIRKYDTDLVEAKQFYDEFSPGLWEELEGVASVLEWPMDEVFHEYSGYQQDWGKSGCSALMKDGFYVRNYDYHPKTYEGRLLLWEPKEGYASIGTSGRMIGRIDGMNEKGLVVGYHLVNRRNPAKGFICATIARFLLDSCASVQEAVKMLKHIPHRHAFNYSLYDAEGHSAVVEASGRGTSVRESVTACTNHFQTESSLTENRYHLEESKKRLTMVENRSSDRMLPNEAFEFFNNPDHGIFKRNYSSWSGTIHTAVYIPETLTMLFGLGENAHPVTIPFGEWLKEKRFPITKIFGSIQSNELFEHQ